MRARPALAVTTSFLSGLCFLSGLGFVACTNSSTKSVAIPHDAGGPASPDAGPSEVVDAGPPDEDAGSPDAGLHDAGLGHDAGSLDAGEPLDAGLTCPPPPTFNYQCSIGDPLTCPMGLCIGSLCLAPIVDQHRWDTCGDGVCQPCETATNCPVDCGVTPPETGAKVYDNNTTITVWLHGFTNKGAKLDTLTYGAAGSCGDLGAALVKYGVNRPCGNTPATEVMPNQVVSVEYYGTLPPAWMTPQDVAEVEAYPFHGGPLGLQRYALIAAKFIRHQMAISGATHVNLACHSMGCLISRYLIENNVENLAAENKIVRWQTNSGVVCGARLARLYDNPTIRKYADAIGLQVDDFIIMNPDYVTDVAASWDHKLHEGNNPLFKGMLIHHVGATDPRIAAALNIQLLDFNNPGDEPNDGIMFTLDEFFHSQSPAASLTTPSGEVLSSTHSYIYAQHSDVTRPESDHVMMIASLFHRRKVFITVDSITLKVDREFSLQELKEQGTSPAEVVVENQVSYILPGIAAPVLVQDDQIAYRSPDMFQQVAGTTLTPGQVIFEGPVFDNQTTLHLKATFTEADLYPRWKVNEALVDANRELVTFDGDVTLQDQVLHVDNAYAAAELRVHLVDQY
jgi:hypothetical protein